MSEGVPHEFELDILYQDHHLIVVNKPARVPVASEDSGDQTLLSMVRRWNSSRQIEGKKGYCVPIHFLDRPVSGAVIFALSSKGAARLNQLFKTHQVQKTYYAVSASFPPQKTGRLVQWMVKDHDANVSRLAHENEANAKKCELTYDVLGQELDKTLFEVRPVTGRSHQIRVQLAGLGCPLIGDVKYGARDGWHGRVALHAAKIEFEHPVSKQPLVVKAIVPRYWQEIWQGRFPE